MSDKYVPGSSVCEHGRLRRQCSDCEVTELYKEIGEKDALIDSQAKEIETQRAWLKNTEAKEKNYDNLRRGFDLAIKALEEYTEDEQYCGRCDGMTYETGNGKVARDALAEIRRRLEGE